MNFERIESLQNPKIKFISKLRDNHFRKKSGKFIVEGIREISRCKREFLEEIYICKELFSSMEEENLLEELVKLQNIKIFELSKNAIQKCSLRNNPDPIICISKEWDLSLGNIKLSKNPLILCLQSVEKPGNLGALIRSAEAANVDGLILTSPKVDFFNPNVIRASQGAIFSSNVAISTDNELFKFLKTNNIEIFCATPRAEKIYWNCSYTKGSAIICGSENDGLSDFWLENKSFCTNIKLPMLGKSDSLNVNDAASILLFEAIRQRFLK